MKKRFILKTVTFLLFVGVISCQEEISEQAQIENDSANMPFNTGTLLSYEIIETSFSTNRSKGAKYDVADENLYSERKEVSVYFDSKSENYQMITKTIDSDCNEEFTKSIVEETVETNYGTTGYNKKGEVIFTNANNQKGSSYFSYLLTAYPERSKQMKEKLSKLTTDSKSGNTAIEYLHGGTVVKISKSLFNDNEYGKEMNGFTAVSYVNIDYGIPVVSELYNPKGDLTSKVTILYNMIDNIPVVAYDESISYVINTDGELIEHKTIKKYENINITNF